MVRILAASRQLLARTERFRMETGLEFISVILESAGTIASIRGLDKVT